MKATTLGTALVFGLAALAVGQQPAGTKEARTETVWEARIRGVGG